MAVWFYVVLIILLLLISWAIANLIDNFKLKKLRRKYENAEDKPEFTKSGKFDPATRTFTSPAELRRLKEAGSPDKVAGGADEHDTGLLLSPEPDASPAAAERNLDGDNRGIKTLKGRWKKKVKEQKLTGLV